MRFAISAMAAISGLFLLGLAFYGQPALYLHQAREQWDALIDSPDNNQPRILGPDQDTQRVANLQQQVTLLQDELAAKQASALRSATQQAPAHVQGAPLAEALQPVAPGPQSSATEVPQPEAPQPEPGQPVARQPEALQAEEPAQAVAAQPEAPQPVERPPEASRPEESPQAVARQPEPPPPEPPQPVARRAEDARPDVSQPVAHQAENPAPEAPQPAARQPEAAYASPAQPAQRAPQVPAQAAEPTAPLIMIPRQKLAVAEPFKPKPESPKPEQPRSTASRSEKPRQEPAKSASQKPAALKPIPPPPPLPRSVPAPQDTDDAQSVLARLRQLAPGPAPVRPADPAPVVEPRSRPVRSPLVPRLTAARNALANGRIEDARRLLQQVQLQLVFRPVNTAGDDLPLAGKGAADVAHALDALSASDLPLGRRYIDTAVNDLSGIRTDSPVSELRTPVNGYAPAYPPR